MIKSLGAQDSGGGFTGFLRNIGILEPSTIGSYLVIDYITSRDFMFSLDKEFSIKKYYGSDKIDLIQRFSPFGLDTSYENFYESYYTKNVVRVKLNPNSSVVTIVFRAPEAKYAKSLSDWTLAEIERFINNINQKSAETKFLYFSERIEEGRKRIQETAEKLKKFIQSTSVLSPEQQVAVTLQTIAKLNEQLLTKQNELARIQYLAPENPKIPDLKREIENLKREINQNMTLLTEKQKGIGPTGVELELLKVELQNLFKEQELNLSSFIQAVHQTKLQQFFIEKIEEPKIADAPAEPKIFKNVIMIFAISFAIWGIISILYAGVKEHSGR